MDGSQSSDQQRGGGGSGGHRLAHQQQPEPAPGRTVRAQAAPAPAAPAPAAPAAPAPAAHALAGAVICRRDRGKGPPGCGALICDADELYRDTDNNLCVFLGSCPSARIATFDGQPELGEGGSARVACGRAGCSATIGVLDIDDCTVALLSAPKKVSLVVHNAGPPYLLTKKAFNRLFVYGAPSVFRPSTLEELRAVHWP